MEARKHEERQQETAPRTKRKRRKVADEKEILSFLSDVMRTEDEDTRIRAKAAEMLLQKLEEQGMEADEELHICIDYEA